jgi:glycosyltransferase involved in cell wall biosynthesis
MTVSSVFVLPTLSESFGIVNLEAMASGLPIVATKVGGLPDIIKSGENGFLVEPKNPEAVAEKILLVLRDDALRERISKNNKDKVKITVGRALLRNWREYIKVICKPLSHHYHNSSQ